MSSPPTNDSDSDPSLAAHAVRALMDRHGVPRNRQASRLAELLGLSYPQAYRRLNVASAWSLEELQTVAGHFGESLSKLVDSSLPADARVDATLRLGSYRLPCQLTLGSAALQPRPQELVALKVDDRWLAMLAGEAPAPGVSVRELVYRSPARARPRIAVLDDNLDTAQAICVHLQKLGAAATAFETPGDLVPDDDAERFDGYVIDWVLLGGVARELIESLRARDPGCPIVVLTGQLATGVADEADIASAKAQFRFDVLEKPARMSILVAALSPLLDPY